MRPDRIRQLQSLFFPVAETARAGAWQPAADVYRTLEIQDGEAQARANPQHRARITEGLAKLTGFLAQLGVIDDERRPVWEELGLVA